MNTLQNQQTKSVDDDLQARLRAAEIAEGPWGFECENCGADSPSAVHMEDRKRLAAADGWGMGLVDGQAHYACPNCLPAYDGVVRIQASESLAPVA